ncbi:MAG TPA: MarR family transcriptional regulator [Caldithrix sp.]|nr:MarR family transcriptional regulator [Caldithrix sp.]
MRCIKVTAKCGIFMADKILDRQIEQLDEAFHHLWHALFLNRPDMKSDKLRGLSFIDMHVIRLASENPDIILREIRQHLKIPQTTLSSIVAKLEKYGLVRRVINPRDLRSFSLKITPAGRKIFAEHKRIDTMQAKEALLALEKGERDVFIGLVRKAANRLKVIK